MRDPAFDPPQDAYDAGSAKSVEPRVLDAANATPSMAQYIEIKAANPDCMLFYRMGDFYELFFSDAELASQTLGIVLTKRGKHGGEDIPMCGVPVHRADDYLQRLIGAGHRVAVCEQMEDPAEAKKRGSKSVVRRDVVRIVTPGTITEEGLLPARRANLLVSLARQKKSETVWDYALAAVDISTGQFVLLPAQEVDLAGEIARLEPSELLVPDSIRDDQGLAPLWHVPGMSITRMAKDGFDAATAQKRLADYYGVSTLEGFGDYTRPELSAAAAIITYLERTQLGARPPLSAPQRIGHALSMMIDAATRANLELTRTLAGERVGSLLATIDRSVTASGGRLLAEWLGAPLTNLPTILARHDAVSGLHDRPDLRKTLRARLKQAPDMIRAMTRLALDRAGPRDMAAIAQGLMEAAQIGRLLEAETDLPILIRAAGENLRAAPEHLARTILSGLREDLPLLKRDGGFIRPGFDDMLDGVHALRDDSRSIILEMQARYAELVEARNLRIKYNNVLGFYIEVPQAIGEKMVQKPLNETFIHRQTMAGAMRFSTSDLGNLQARIAQASDEVLKLELQHFATFSASLLADDAAIRAASAALAQIDALSALAELAAQDSYVRPVLTNGAHFAIEAGRHPVVESALRREGESFIANGCDLSPDISEDAGHILLVTGANMAGKSTYLRQNALIAILAQMGSFVPARTAKIGIVDRLFSRVGAADDLARGRSTFMVEMVETAAILNLATAQSLVILDEIGRGTATYDGLSIAWAAMEHLHDTNRCRALFATHFHELTALTGKLSRLKPVTMKVAAYKGDVVFLHEVVAGAADRSYGIQVAKLAGLPAKVVTRAGAILKELEAVDRASPITRLVDDLPLFRLAHAEQAPPKSDMLRQVLAQIDPDDLTPRDALEALYRLKKAGQE